MKVIAKKNRELALINAQNTQNENRAEIIELVVPEEYESYNKKIVFITSDGNVWDVITNNEYKITNAITKYDKVDFYIWLTKGDVDFRTKTKTLNFYHNEDASDEITDEEIHGVNTVVNLLEEEIEKVENLNIEATKIGSTTTVTITKKDGTTESVEINDGVDGKDGEDGKDAKINGKNSIEIEAGNNITIDNTETGIRINSTNDGGTTDYTDLENKPKINNVELSGNKSLNDLGIQPKGNYIEDNNYVHTDNNFNNTYKNKLEGLENYDDTEIKADISDIQDEQTEQNTEIEKLQTENARLKATLPTTTGEGKTITLDKTADMEFITPPLPMGNSEQFSTTGKQILNLTTVTGGYNITQPALTNGIVHAQGNNSEESNTSFRNGYVEFKNTEAWETNTTYYVSMKIDILQNPKNVSTFLCMLFGDGNIGTYIAYNSTTKRYEGHMSTTDTVPTEANKKYIELRLASCELNISEILLSKSSDTSYEPYTGATASPNPDYPQEITNVTGDVEVVVGNKNLILTKDWINATINPDGSYNTTSSQERLCSTYIPIDIGKDNLTFSFNTVMDFFGIAFYDEDKNYINRAYLNQNNKITSQILSNSKYVKVFINKSGLILNGNSFEQYELQLEYNITPSTYIPHKEQTFIFPLGNEKLMLGDYLADDGIHHVRGQIELTEDNINLVYAVVPTNPAWGDASPHARIRKQSLGMENSYYSKCILNSYSKVTVTSEIKTGTFSYNFDSNNIYVFDEKFTDLATARQLLIGTVIEYELAEEVITPYTSAQQEVYNQIKQALSYEEQTNISSNTIALFNVEAYQDIKEKIEEAGGHTHNNKAVLDGISSADITRWNNKSDFSGDYNDLSNKPTIPDVSGFITKDVNNLTNYTLKTNTGSLIDLEINNTTYVVTMKLKDVDGNVISTDTIDLPLETVVVSGRYDNTTKKVILTLENGSEVDFSVADLVAGLQTEITSSNKLASDLVDDTNSGNKFVTTSEKQTWNGKYDKPSTGIPKTDLASDVQTSLGKADTALQSHQDISGKANKISVVQTSTSTIEINSNTFYKFGEVASLNITLASITDNTIYNEYMFEFVSGTTATTLTLPSSIKWLETPTIDANKIYQCSIVDNVGLLVGVTNV